MYSMTFSVLLYYNLYSSEDEITRTKRKNKKQKKKKTKEGEDKESNDTKYETVRNVDDDSNNSSTTLTVGSR